MKEVIHGVLCNAVEAMPDGGTVWIEAGVVSEGAACGFLETGPHTVTSIRLNIRDQGHGIAEADLGRIFDPYFSTKQRGIQKGMGLGLTQAYAVIEQHRGQLRVSSAKGNGTTVEIVLPVAAKSPSVDHPGKEPECRIR